MNKFICLVFSFFMLITSMSCFAGAGDDSQPRSVTCVNTSYKMETNSKWYMSVKMTAVNNCQEPIEFKNAVINFDSPFSVSQKDFTPHFNYPLSLSWAAVKSFSSRLAAKEIGQPADMDNYDNNLTFNYSGAAWHKSELLPGKTFEITLRHDYQGNNPFLNKDGSLNKQLADYYFMHSFLVLVPTSPVNPEIKGSLTLKVGHYPNSELAGKKVELEVTGPSLDKKYDVAWNNNLILPDLKLGEYHVAAVALDHSGKHYEGSMDPSDGAVTLTAQANQLVMHVNYKEIINKGNIHFQIEQAPVANAPKQQLRVYDEDANTQTFLQSVDWGSTHKIENLHAGHSYEFSMPNFTFNGKEYSSVIDPLGLVVQKGDTANVKIHYREIQTDKPVVLDFSVNQIGLPTDASPRITLVDQADASSHPITLPHTGKIEQGSYRVDIGGYTHDGEAYSGTASENPFVVAPATSGETNDLMITYKKQDKNIKHRIVAYFTAWGIYGRGYNVTDIPADKINTINYAFINIRNGECVLGDTWADTDKRFPAVSTPYGTYPADSWNGPQKEYYGNFNRLNELKKLNPHVDVMMSIGGWTWSKDFSNVALTKASRDKFVNSCTAMMQKYKLDGIDIDWEYPVSGGLASNTYRSQDKQNYTLLLQDFRKKMNEVSSGKHYLLTIAAPAGPKKMNNLEWGKIANIVDWINLMSYDFHGGWENVTGHNSPLYHNPNDPSTDPDANKLNTDSAVQYLIGGATPRIPSNKLVIGVGFYGRGWDGVANVNHGLFQPGKGASVGTWENGVFDYKDLVANYIPTYQKFDDGLAGVPYLWNATKGIFISYEDPKSMKLKAEYVKDQGLLGAMFWELSGDTKTSDLLNALYTELK